MIYVTDTHSLIWFLTNDSRLGKNALKVFESADKGEDIIIIPAIVLAEISYICEKKNIGIRFNGILDKLKNSLNYLPSDLDLEVIIKAQEFRSMPDLHDRIIIATARLFNAKLVTKDTIIKNSGYVECVW